MRTTIKKGAKKTARKKASKRTYLTKRKLASAARRSIRNAAAETLKVMGYTVIAENGWVVKKFRNGTTKKIARIKKVNTSGDLALD